MRIRTLIVDDEPLAREGIRLRLEQLALEARRGVDGSAAAFEIVGECASGGEAVAAIRREAPDLLFLDVQMPGAGGFEILAEVGVEAVPTVVFVTAHDHYAVEAFRVHALDYLLKPIDDARFRATLARVQGQLGKDRLSCRAEQLRTLLAAAEDESAALPVAVSRSEIGQPVAAMTPDWLKRLLVRQRERLAVVPVEELDWVESAGDYVYLHTRREKHLLRETMANLERRLDPRRFQRIHRRAIINLERLRELRPEDHGEYRVLLTDGTLLRLGRSYRQRFLNALEG